MLLLLFLPICGIEFIAFCTSRMKFIFGVIIKYGEISQVDWLKSRSQSLHRTQKRCFFCHRKNWQTGKQWLTQLALIIKGTLFLGYLPIFFLLYSIPVDFVRQKTARLMLGLLGVYEIEDFAIEKYEKKGQCTRILSNHSCFLDILYYLYRYISNLVKISRLQFPHLQLGLRWNH